MLTHLIILLDDTSASYCHYNACSGVRRLISIEHLKAGILFAMKENLNIQFVYPDYALPQEYDKVIETIDHSKLAPDVYPGKMIDIWVLDHWESCPLDKFRNQTCIIRTTWRNLSVFKERIRQIIAEVGRLNIVITDVESFQDGNIEDYRHTLDEYVEILSAQYAAGHSDQLNILTDRVSLREMNNCNAGDTNVTLAPNGKFYLCPAFYYENDSQSVGDLERGLCIMNKQLLRIDHAPICRNCDAFQCKRCIWMNGRLTLDYNTPSHQQCVMAHLERNASSRLQAKLRQMGYQKKMDVIEEISELDPFNYTNKWK